MDDMISKQAAIDAIRKHELVDLNENRRWYNHGLLDAKVAVLALPSAQPIVRCKDCKYYTPIKRTDIWRCRCDEGLWQSSDDDFCSKAERRTDG